MISTQEDFVNQYQELFDRQKAVLANRNRRRPRVELHPGQPEEL